VWSFQGSEGTGRKNKYMRLVEVKKGDFGKGMKLNF
jgi:hypothetical protein